MSGMSSDSQSDSESTQVMSGINITPFVDVVLVLLVIFMITAPALVKEMIDIKLPKTSTSDGQVLQTLGIALNTETLKTRYPKTRKFFYGQRALYVVLVVVILFFILRNI